LIIPPVIRSIAETEDRLSFDSVTNSYLPMPSRNPETVNCSFNTYYFRKTEAKANISSFLHGAGASCIRLRHNGALPDTGSSMPPAKSRRLQRMNASESLPLRVDLAALFRIAARLQWTEAVANHCSAAVSADGRQFLINPKLRLFGSIRASELLLIDAQAAPAALPPELDATAWAIHGTMHARRPLARCILHLHPPYATALSCLADPQIKPIDQTSARFYGRVAIDSNYGGMADNAKEGLRLTRALADKRVLMMGNHGVLVVGDSVAEAFDALYHLERASRTLVLAYSTGQPLQILSHEIAEKTARSWEDGGEFAEAHFRQMKRLLDAEEPSYAQ
jgi:ribulose-5-phosphate 4-epimerase/fuculose-1-phosphate aldolase